MALPNTGFPTLQNLPAHAVLVRIGWYFKLFKGVEDTANMYFKAALAISSFVDPITNPGQLVNTPYAKGPRMSEIIMLAQRREPVPLLEGLINTYGRIGNDDNPGSP
jgi:hypothetical protein